MLNVKMSGLPGFAGMFPRVSFGVVETPRKAAPKEAVRKVRKRGQNKAWLCLGYYIITTIGFCVDRSIRTKPTTGTYVQVVHVWGGEGRRGGKMTRPSQFTPIVC